MLKLLKGGFFLEFVCVELATGVVLDVQLAARSCLVRTLEFLLTWFQSRVTGGGSYLQVGASVDCAATYRIPVLLLPYNHIIHYGAGNEC